MRQLIELLRFTEALSLLEQIERGDIETARVARTQQRLHTCHATLRYGKDRLEAAAERGAAILGLSKFFGR